MSLSSKDVPHSDFHQAQSSPFLPYSWVRVAGLDAPDYSRDEDQPRIPRNSRGVLSTNDIREPMLYACGDLKKELRCQFIRKQRDIEVGSEKFPTNSYDSLQLDSE